MKTEIETVGFGGGFTDARSNAAARRAVPLVQVRTRQGSYLGNEKKDARPKRQLRTGASDCSQQLTEDILTHMPRWKRWGFYALAAGLITGIIPLAVAELLADAFNGVLLSLESLIGQGMMAALGIGLCITAIIACMAYLFRLVER
ncbi:hypothetical protein [uncultured Collinsella sp.]|uniref:hypothetical protein n=1 Tax=uncultured Collinsella sp. TaxID=165190 RepID=UPI002671DE76|nr:hypothetical protein [uncultured Collinsella sp.]